TTRRKSYHRHRRLVPSRRRGPSWAGPVARLSASARVRSPPHDSPPLNCPTIAFSCDVMMGERPWSMRFAAALVTVGVVAPAGYFGSSTVQETCIHECRHQCRHGEQAQGSRPLSPFPSCCRGAARVSDSDLLCP